MKLNLNDTFNRELPADPRTENIVRQVPDAAFSYVAPKKPGAPALIHVSPPMLEAVGHPVATFEGNRRNIKITTPDDLVLAEAWLD